MVRVLYAMMKWSYLVISYFLMYYYTVMMGKYTKDTMMGLDTMYNIMGMDTIMELYTMMGLEWLMLSSYM